MPVYGEQRERRFHPPVHERPLPQLLVKLEMALEHEIRCGPIGS